MGLKWSELGENILGKTAKSDRPPGVLTAIEATEKMVRISEAKEQSLFNQWCEHAEERGELTRDWSATHKPATRRPGWPDFTIAPDHKPTFYIEFKLPAGRLSKDQDRQFRLLTTLGHNVFIVPNADEAICVVRRELAKPHAN